jgi:serine/threonine protein kinase
MPLCEQGTKDLISSRLSEKIQDLVRLLLTPNPEKRPTIDELDLLLSNFYSFTVVPLTDDALEIKRQHQEHERV